MIPDNGGESASPPSTLSNTFLLVAFVSVALYNVLELTFIIFATFKKRSGLYFWSFCIAIWGIPPYSIGFLLRGLGINQSATYAYVTLIVVGWYCTVTGQSVVLYSRLHLVDRNKRHRRFVLAMIIINAIVLHSVTTVMVYGANSPIYSSHFIQPYSIVEKVQLFRGSIIHTKSNRARILRHLITVNVVVILLDMTILGLEYADLYQLQTAYKGMAYSIKLKLEFNILNELVKLTRSHSNSTSAGLNDYIFNESPRGNTRRESLRQSEVSPTALSSGQTESRAATTPRTQTRDGSTLDVKPASSAHASDKLGIRYPREDRILVTRTIDVDFDFACDTELVRP